MNYYTLNKEIDDKWTPQIKSFIDNISNSGNTSLNLTGISELNPSRVRDILVDKIGYEETDFDSNGWDWDFWFYFKKEGFAPLVLRGTGLSFELYLEYKEDN